ncbi:MAG: hypothetical protein U9O20_03250 [Patescibacteria group bacterium]|nr:hypothetical protein [Patescibacteria group bacterium]
MKNRRTSSVGNGTFSFPMLLVTTMFLVLILAVCFSLLIYDIVQLDAERNNRLQADEKTQQIQTEMEQTDEKMDPEEIKVSEISGVITSVKDGKITFKTSVYGEEEQEIAIVLDEKERGNIIKYKTEESSEDGKLGAVSKFAVKYDDLKSGDMLTVRFPLEVPLKEVRDGALLIEEIIVDDEFDQDSQME